MANDYRNEIKKIIIELRRQGWRIESNKHWHAYPPNPSKRMVSFASTPSDHRAIMNIKHDLRRQGANF